MSPMLYAPALFSSHRSFITMSPKISFAGVLVKSAVSLNLVLDLPRLSMLILFITHTDKDHTGGLKWLRKSDIEIKAIYASRYYPESTAKKHKLGVVRELVGHGMGTSLHEEPDVPNYGVYNTGITLKTGMTLAVEPMLNLGTRKIYILDDDWTIVTRDKKPSAHFEHTVVVRDDGYEILTGE